jgi:hypothetical protein
LLVSAAFVFAFLSVAKSNDQEKMTAVVARTDIAKGVQIGIDDLDVVQIPKNRFLANRTIPSVASITSATSLRSIVRGDLIQRSDVVETPTATPAALVSMSLEREFALNGELRVGDVIDVLATTKGSSDPSTDVVATKVEVVHVQSSQSGTTGANNVQFILSLHSNDEALKVIHAYRTADVTIILSTFANNLPAASGKENQKTGTR